MGPINGNDILCFRQMLGGSEFKDAEKGKLTTLDLSEATIVLGGRWYYQYYSYDYYTSKNVIGGMMFYQCVNLKTIVLPENITSIDNHSAFSGRRMLMLPCSLTLTSQPMWLNTPTGM